MQKKQVFYIHGGDSFENHEDFLERLRTAALWHLPKQDDLGSSKKWTSTLQEDLGDGYEVIMPPMPNKQNAKYEEWKIWFERHFDFLTDGAILMGCSLGAMFLAKYFSEGNTPFVPKAIILMAGAYALPGFPDTDCKDFLVAPESVHPMLNKAGQVVIVHSTDDPVVPYEHGAALSQALPEAQLMTFEDKNHFLVEEFPELVQKIQNLA
jgi:predicted alpha/beta hydrolase family esterase